MECSHRGNTRSIVSVLLLTCIVVVIGSTVEQASVTTFQPGTPALASEINGNFQALIDAIDDNAARIEDLEQGSTSLTAEDLIADSTYRFMTVPMTLGGANVATEGEWRYRSDDWLAKWFHLCRPGR